MAIALKRRWTIKRVNVSVPDDLHAEMEAYKDRFNYSGLFQEKVRDSIEKVKRFENRLKEATQDMEAIIERLKKEKSEINDYFYERGKKEGLDWAKTAHYSEIQSMLKWKIPEVPDDEDFRDIILENIKEDDELENCDPDPGPFRWLDENTEQYFQGVQDAFIAFWAEVSPHL